MSEKKDFTFSKSEKLCGEKRIDALFTSGRSFIVYPLRVVFSPDKTQTTPISVMVSVSKKKFKRAVKRNRVKRLIREAYRQNKEKFHCVGLKNGTHYNLAFLYLKSELPTYAEIAKAMEASANLFHEKASATKSND